MQFLNQFNELQKIKCVSNCAVKCVSNCRCLGHAVVSVASARSTRFQAPLLLPSQDIPLSSICHKIPWMNLCFGKLRWDVLKRSVAHCMPCFPSSYRVILGYLEPCFLMNCNDMPTCQKNPMATTWGPVQVDLESVNGTTPSPRAHRVGRGHRLSDLLGDTGWTGWTGWTWRSLFLGWSPRCGRGRGRYRERSERSSGPGGVVASIGTGHQAIWSANPRSHMPCRCCQCWVSNVQKVSKSQVFVISRDESGFCILMLFPINVVISCHFMWSFHASESLRCHGFFVFWHQTIRARWASPVSTGHQCLRRLWREQHRHRARSLRPAAAAGPRRRGRWRSRLSTGLAEDWSICNSAQLQHASANFTKTSPSVVFAHQG